MPNELEGFSDRTRETIHGNLVSYDNERQWIKYLLHLHLDTV